MKLCAIKRLFITYLAITHLSLQMLKRKNVAVLDIIEDGCIRKTPLRRHVNYFIFFLKDLWRALMNIRA